MPETKAKIVISAKDKTKAAFERSEKRLNSLAKNAARAGAAVAAIGGVALVSAINVTRKFNEAVSDLSAITGATGKDLEFLRKKSKEFGATTTLSARQAAEAFKLVASAKPDLLENAEALARVTKEAISLAEASGTELPEAANTLGNALNQFGAGAEKAGEFINTMAAGAKFGASSIVDISKALAESGTVASAAKVSFEETNAALQLLATRAIKGGKAGTALKNILINLQTAGDDSINPAIVGLSQALENLKEKNLTAGEAAKLFGKENLAAGLALVDMGGDLKDMTIKLTDTNVAYEQASIKVDNLSGDIKKFQSALEALAIESMEKEMGGLRDSVQEFTDLLTDKGTIQAVQDLSAALVTVVTASAKALKGITNFTKFAGEGFARFREKLDISDFLTGPAGAVNQFKKLREALAEVGQNDALVKVNKEISEMESELSALLELEQQRQIDPNMIMAGIPKSEKIAEVTAELERMREVKAKMINDQETARIAATEQTPEAAGGIVTPPVAIDEEAGDPAVSGGGLTDDKIEKELEQIRRFTLTRQEIEQEDHLVRLQLVTKNMAEGDARNKVIEKLALKHQKTLTDIKKQGASARQGVEKTAALGAIQNALQLAAQINGLVDASDKKAFERKKKMSKGIAIISTAVTIMRTMADYGYPAGLVPSALALAMGVKQIQAISSQTYSGGGSVGGVSGGGGGGGDVGGVTPSIPESNIPQIPETVEESTAPQEAQRPTVQVIFQEGSFVTDPEGFAKKMNEFVGNGGTLNATAVVA